MVIEIADFVLPVSAQEAFHLLKLRLAFGVVAHEVEALPIEVKLFEVDIVFGSWTVFIVKRVLSRNLNCDLDNFYVLIVMYHEHQRKFGFFVVNIFEHISREMSASRVILVIIQIQIFVNSKQNFVWF